MSNQDYTRIADIQHIISPLLGQSAWSVWVGHGSFVTFEFGKPVTIGGSLGSYRRGEWHLWVYVTTWCLESENDVLSATEDNREHMQEQLNKLEGLPLRSIEFIPPSLETLLHFDSNLTMRISPIYSNDMVSWYLFDPTGYALVIKSNGQWVYQRSDSSE